MSSEGPLAASPMPWARRTGVEEVLAAWRADGRVWHNIALDATLTAQPAKNVPVPEDLPAGVLAALAARGIHSLYSHQARAIELGRARQDFVIATPTASGKSLCFNLPVLECLSREGGACALYLFPTKALARDQEEALRQLLADAGLHHGAVTYDGDTPGDARRAAKQKSGVLITNPDMLHAGILPHHTAWARLFANLRFIIIDELHTYRGVFGSHLANLLRRLLRLARFHGAAPQLIFASATIGNPEAHASRMRGAPVALLSESGAPSAERSVLLYNPPVVNAELGIRQSYVKAAVRLTEDLVAARVPTLVFGQSRNNVEVMLKYLRDKLSADIDAERIVAYRGGYLPDTRRRIEAGLRAGDIACVVATNALELGIDIGSLDAVVCAGYPGSIAALWQRFGRGGRRGAHALSVLVTSSAPLDQYFAAEPEILLGAPVEEARIDPDNIEILIQHLKCAAFELPMQEGEAFGDLPAEAVKDGLEFLSQHRVVHAVTQGDGPTVYHWSTDAYPANHVSLRSVGWDNFVVVDQSDGPGQERTIAEMDWRSTHTMLHEQAIYQHEGQQFQVERLDFDNHKAFVRKVAPDYFTTAMTNTDVSVLDCEEQDLIACRERRHGEGLAVGCGEVSVVEKVVGFKKIKYHTHENAGYGEVRLPEMQMHTSAVWWTFPSELVAAQDVPPPIVVDAIRGLSVALHTVAVVGLMIDPRDLGRTLNEQPHPVVTGDKATVPSFSPTLYLFDRVPGGIGLAPRLFTEQRVLWQRVRRLLRHCRCEQGCPACIGPMSEAVPQSLSRKALGLALLQAMELGDA